jgi:3-dehydroquinate synthase II
MRKIWVKIDPWDKKLVTTALESGVDGVLLPKGFSEKVKALGKVQTISEDGDLILGKDVIYFNIASGEDEGEIVRLSQIKQVILQCSDWTIIPLENLIAKGANVIAQVQSLEDAQTAFGILEKGVGHVLYQAGNVGELKTLLNWIRSEGEKILLQETEIIEVSPIGMGDRVCVDTCTSMTMGQGILVGNSSSALFLVHSESIANPYVSPRPFRVNAGPVHAYTRVPGGKTKYLSELSAGDNVLIVDFKGHTTTGIIGRLKIEKRPLMLVKAAVGDHQFTSIVQNAETIRLTDVEGNARSVVNLTPGDKVLAAIEEGGRHFGIKIEESIMEK